MAKYLKEELSIIKRSKMAFYDRTYFFENPEILAIVLGILVFVLAFYVLRRFMDNRGAVMVISLVIGLITGWALYQNEFYGFESALVILIYVAVIGLFLKIAWAFLKGARRNIGA